VRKLDFAIGVKEIVAEQLGFRVEEILDGAFLKEDGLGMDSLDLVEFSLILEDAFDIEIPDADLNRFRTVQDVIDYVKNKKEN
jgi:acyl carrier protein